MSSRNIFTFAGIFFACTLHSQVVLFTDQNFKDALVFNTMVNTNGDTEIQVSEAESFTGTLTVTYKNISDLGGIGAFKNLTGLDCSNNELKTIDVSGLKELRRLVCDVNYDLYVLNVSGATKLEVLWCSFNHLQQIDVSSCSELTSFCCTSTRISSLSLTNNKKLTTLICENNNLYSLDLSPCSKLQVLACANDKLNGLNLSANVLLEELTCSYNNLNALDVSNCPLLKKLWCHNNKIEQIDLVANKGLRSLICSSNQLAELDIRPLEWLAVLYCEDNLLKKLVLKDQEGPLSSFDARWNEDLECIEVDDPAEWYERWPDAKPTTAAYLQNCSYPIGTSENAEYDLINIFPNPGSSLGELNIEARYASSYSITNSFGQQLVAGKVQPGVNQIKPDLPAGVYFISFGMSYPTKKLIVN